MAYNLDGYVTVAERLTQAHEQLTTVVSEPPVMLTDVMGYIRATVALKDGRSATATASFRLDLPPGNRSAQATNPLEDCETSAIGRALGFLGYGSAKSVASREEIQEAERRGGAQFTPRQPQAPRPQAVPANGAPICDVCGAIGRLGKDKQSYYCPQKDQHGGKWYTIPAAKRTLPDDWNAEYDAIEGAA